MTDFWQRIQPRVYKFITTAEVQIGVITLIIHLVAVAFFMLVPFDFLSKGIDHIFYFETGSQIAALFKQGVYRLGDVYFHHWYPLFLGVVFYVFGSSMVIGTVINALLAGISAVLGYRILREIAISEKIAYWGTLVLFCGYAGYVYHSSILLKEAWIVALLLGILYLCLRLASGRGNRALVFSIILVLFIFLRSIRFFIGLAVITGVFIEWFLNTTVTFRKKIFQGIAMLGCVIAIIIIFHGRPIIGSITVFDAMHLDLVNKIRGATLADGVTTTGIRVIEKKTIETTNNKNKVRYGLSTSGVIRSLVTTTLGPFPWQVSLKKYLASLPDLLLWYAILGISVWGIVSMRWIQIKKILPWIIVGGIILVAVTMGTASLGAIVRQRIPAVIVFGLGAITSLDFLIKKYGTKKG